MFGTNPDGTGPDEWGRPEDSQLYGTVPLTPVMEWVFNRYHVEFTDGEDGRVVATRDFIGVDGPNIERDFDREWGGMSFPAGADYYHWDLVEEDVRVRRYQTNRGVRIEGDGWQECQINPHPKV